MVNEENLRHWKRLEFDGTPIYVQEQAPSWLVPTGAGDRLIRRIQHGEPWRHGPDPLWPVRARHLISQMETTKPEPYTGRMSSLVLDRLEEFWFHVTDHCNLACKHCLFSCSPSTRVQLSFDDFHRAFLESYALGARIFFLTGGEPLMHPRFPEICDTVLRHSDQTHLVILTNGLMLKERWREICNLPAERLHFQISVDGDRKRHDRIRGSGCYDRLVRILDRVGQAGLHANLAMAVSRENLEQMAHPVVLAKQHGMDAVHFLWLLVTGKARPDTFVPPEELFDALVAVQQDAEENGIEIDNITALAGRVFSPPGTRHDLGGGAWTSLAMGPNGRVYPTPALVGQKPACGGQLKDGIENVWRQSPTFRQIRSLSVATDADEAGDPLRFISGGSDLDHSYTASGRFSGGDPYRPLYGGLAKWLIAERARQTPDSPLPTLRLAMGDRLQSCDNGGHGVSLTHSNCVLSMAQTREVVSAFYAEAAVTPNTDIANPVCYEEKEIAHIPQSARVRSYGCGSPVMDAGLKPGETLLDLGSGAGVECFIGAKKVGKAGSVVGIDMTDDMLALANGAVTSISKNLGYDNVTFKKGFLEAIPLEDGTADAVISNCVVNLSEDKHRTFSEIYRVLKPGGRLVISDVTTDRLPPAAILNDAKLRGECISGALVQNRLVSLLESIGFRNIRFLKRFFYREVKGHRFYSLTYAAYRPGGAKRKTVVYPGPFSAVVTDSGQMLLRGELTDISWNDGVGEDDALFVLDDSGNAIGSKGESSCACYTPPEELSAEKEPSPIMQPAVKMSADCMKCGSPLAYFNHDRPMGCCFCGETLVANAACTQGHFVCDRCHSQDADAVVRRICLLTNETDMITLTNTIRSHPAFPLHGPEHHFAVPGAIVATYRNLGGDVTAADINTAIDRGKGVPGGSCGFWGGCGAALGAGIAFGVILKSSPVTPAQRKIVQTLTGTLISDLGQIEAARCCQREIWSVLKRAAEVSRQILPIALKADGDTRCRQMHRNKECPGKLCQWFPEKPAVSIPNV